MLNILMFVTFFSTSFKFSFTRLLFTSTMENISSLQSLNTFLYVHYIAVLTSPDLLLTLFGVHATRLLCDLMSHAIASDRVAALETQ